MWLPNTRLVHLPLFLLLLVVCALAGCKKGGRSVAPRFRQIDAMLSAKLPKGTTRSRVIYFLSSRGYPMADGSEKDSIVSTVQQVDTQTLQPVVARVTFHFDSNDRLTSCDVQPAPEAPVHP
jgi:hypothetical protein